MTFINTDGLSFLGPGSEWFWTAVSAITLVATLLAIYRQVLLQRGLKEAQQFEELSQEWESERFLRSRRSIALTLQEGGDLEPLAATGRIGDFWDKLGSLVRAGHVGRGQITAQWADIILIYWTMLEPSTLSHRAMVGQPTEYEHFEWLATVMLRDGHDHSRALTPLNAERIDTWIAQLNESIALEESLRALPAVRQPQGEA